MDSDFMNNLANMMKNGNIPDSVKEKMNRIYEPKLTDKILTMQVNQKMNQILHLIKTEPLIIILLTLKCYKI